MILTLTFAGGLALFLLALLTMSGALGAALSSGVRSRLNGASVSASFAVGAVVTAIIQSSTLVSVTILGLTQAGAMQMAPAFAAIVGANIGTTVTSQLAGVRPVALGWVALVAGLMLIGSSWIRPDGNDSRVPGRAMKGVACFAFAGLVLGLEVMAQSSEQAFDAESIKAVLCAASKTPVVGFAAGCVITAILHSSSLVSVMLVNLGRQRALTLEAALALMLGSNVGTCVTALVASAASGRHARVLANANMLFNLAGALIFLPFVQAFASVLRATSSDPGVQLANGHALFNIATALAVLPFSSGFVRLVGGLGKESRFDVISSGSYSRHRPRAYRVSTGIKFRPSGPSRLNTRS